MLFSYIPRHVPVLYLHSNNPFVVTSPSSLCLTYTFQSISQAIADPLAKKRTSEWLKKRAKCFSVAVPRDISFLQAFRVLSLFFSSGAPPFGVSKLKVTIQTTVENGNL